MSKKTERKRAGPAKGDFRNRIENASEREQPLTRIAEALGELYELLEEYAPAWYTREHQKKARAALQAIRLRGKIRKAI